VAPEQLALQRLYHWEKTAPDRVILTQPLGGGAIRDFTWGEAMAEVRRMAAHLRSLGFRPAAGSRLLSKNCAHWLLADFAIWMAGHVSVPLYPTLAAGTIRQILEHMRVAPALRRQARRLGGDAPGVPRACPASACRWRRRTTIRSGTRSSRAPRRCTDARARRRRALDHHVHLGHDRQPKGVMHSFATFAWSIATGSSACRSTATRAC
jgi:long-chain acyl-CoA synthetase